MNIEVKIEQLNGDGSAKSFVPSCLVNVITVEKTCSLNSSIKDYGIHVSSVTENFHGFK